MCAEPLSFNLNHMHQILIWNDTFQGNLYNVIHMAMN